MLNKHNFAKQGGFIISMTCLLLVAFTSENDPEIIQVGSMSLSPIVAFLLLTVAVVVPVIALGGLLTLGYNLLDKGTSGTKDSDNFAPKATAYAQKEAEKLKLLQESRPTSVNSESFKHWPRIGTAFLFGLFGFFIGGMLDRSYFPHGLFQIAGYTVSAKLLTFLLFAWGSSSLFTQQDLTEDDKEATIPWHWVFMILVGALVFVTGFGIMGAVNETAGSWQWIVAVIVGSISIISGLALRVAEQKKWSAILNIAGLIILIGGVVMNMQNITAHLSTLILGSFIGSFVLISLHFSIGLWSLDLLLNTLDKLIKGLPSASND